MTCTSRRRRTDTAWTRRARTCRGHCRNPWSTCAAAASRWTTTTTPTAIMAPQSSRRAGRARAPRRPSPAPDPMASLACCSRRVPAHQRTGGWTTRARRSRTGRRCGAAGATSPKRSSRAATPTRTAARSATHGWRPRARRCRRAQRCGAGGGTWTRSSSRRATRTRTGARLATRGWRLRARRRWPRRRRRQRCAPRSAAATARRSPLLAGNTLHMASPRSRQTLSPTCS
mmetsp:Transcript_13171/g.38295  ORF Transcript_13171/g.38295 Transcript_13171/m.38295 type:complete len:230 (+) Transcript_13171:991-1680(+)